MKYLMKLELKKHPIAWFIKGSILANVLIVSMLILLIYVEQLEGEVVYRTASDFYMTSGILIRATFIVFAAVLISKLVIDEFKNRTSLVLFSYPINRKSLMIAKILLIFALTLSAMVISTLVVVGSFIGLNELFGFADHLNLTSQSIWPELLSMMLFNIVAAGTSLVPVYFGMRKHSVPATIVSSLIIILITNSSLGTEFSLINLLYLPAILAAVAVIIVMQTVQKVDRMDLR
ncbi:ABC transporter permease [Alkalihalobacillus sp. FSL W8-0930]